MKVFISWSGDQSKAIGEVFRKWLPSVIQAVRPYFAPDDIEKGTRWDAEISKELQDSQLGIMIVTPESRASLWMVFEAGALSKQVDSSRICPVLFGMQNTDLQGPLIKFQTTRFTQEDMRKLVRSVNNACGDQKVDDAVLDEAFEMWWPRLEQQVMKLLADHAPPPVVSPRTERELIEEILSLVRASAARASATITLTPLALADLVNKYRAMLRAREEQGDFETLAPRRPSQERPITVDARVPQPISVTAPADGDHWVVGDTVRISWTPPDNIREDASVDITIENEATRSGQKIGTTTNTGIFLWTVTDKVIGDMLRLWVTISISPNLGRNGPSAGHFSISRH